MEEGEKSINFFLPRIKSRKLFFLSNTFNSLLKPDAKL